MADKKELHPKNKHNKGYDFEALVVAYPQLGRYVVPNKYGNLSVDFFDPKAVKALNKALLLLYYDLTYWDIPESSLCPPVPGRADYIHYVSDLLGSGKPNVMCLDVGVGANCIYPIIGSTQYGWGFVGSDTDLNSIRNAQEIIDNNTVLIDKIELRVQPNTKSIFEGVVREDDFFDVTICNPPFNDSQESAEKGSSRKIGNLKGHKVKGVSLNFGGKSTELWCDGGELQFISTMITESRSYSRNCRWFTSLVSKESNLKLLCRRLKEIKVTEFKVLNMRQGNKISRILAWRY